MKRICSVYHSSKKMGMYLYVLRADALRRVPAPLLEFDLVLTPERTLVREDITQVLRNLDEQGYHLQMPPPEDEYLQHWPDELLHRNDPM